MSYSTLIQEEGITNEFLVVLTPARNVTSWTSAGSNIYTNSFQLGYVSGVEVDGNSQTLASSSAVTSGEYYWDNDNNTLYIYSTGPGSEYIVVYYELYFGTKGAHFPRIPTSAKSATNIDVYFDPVVISSPSFDASLTDSLFGYLPSKTSNIIIGNPEHSIETHIYESSFNDKQIKIYHWLGELKTANMKKLVDGRMKNITYQPDRVTISVLDRIDIFDKEYRNTNNSFYNTTDFPNIESSFVGRPIRYVYGRADNCYLVNLDYEVDVPTTTNNRTWAVREGAANTYTGTVPLTPVSTTTRSYVDSAAGVSVGDLLWVDTAVDEYVRVTSVNVTGDNYIEHTTLGGGALLNGDTLKRGTLGNLYVNQGGVNTALYYNRDYTESVSNNVVTITLDANAEVNAGITTLTGTEQLYGRIYGEQNDVTKDGGAFGADSTNYNSLTNPAVILFDLLKQSGVLEDDIDLTSFDTLSSSIGSKEIGFSLPKTKDDNFPKYKQIFTDIFESTLCQLFIDSNGKWSVDTLKVLPSADVSIYDTEIVNNTIRYIIDYNDIISNVIVSYNYRESMQSGENVSATSNTALFLHNVKRQKTFNSLLINSSDASNLATQLSDIFGDRKGYIEFSCKNRFFNNYISDTIAVNLEKHVGFDYIKGSENTRSYEILEINKNSNTIKIKASDQKGIQDNSGDF